MTYSTSLLPIVDALAALITVPDSMSTDATGAAPPKYAPDVFYLWPRSQTPRPEGDGSTDWTTFRLRAAWSRAGQGEAMGQTRLRAISEQLDAGVKAIVDAVRANRTNEGLWRSLEVEDVTYDAVVTFDVRAAWVDITGWRLVASGAFSPAFSEDFDV